MDKFIIAQIFGFAGLACSVAAYQCKKAQKRYAFENFK